MTGIVYDELVAFACEFEDVPSLGPLHGVAVALVRETHRQLDGLPATGASVAAVARVTGQAVRQLADLFDPPAAES